MRKRKEERTSVTFTDLSEVAITFIIILVIPAIFIKSISNFYSVLPLVIRAGKNSLL